MFCYKKKKETFTEPLSEGQFYRLLRSKRWNDSIDKYRQTGEGRYKSSLPCFCFQANFEESYRIIKDKKTKKVIGREKGRWSVQKHCLLTGLVVLDIDHVKNPEEVINGKWRIENGKLVAREEWVATNPYPLSTIQSALSSILLLYITPSGEGIKVVFKAKMEWGNLSDNQIEMAKLLGVEFDDSGKDASRTAFICKEEDVKFIDKEIFTYEDKEFAEKYNDQYRNGDSSPANHNDDGSLKSAGNHPVAHQETGSATPESGKEADGLAQGPIMWRGYDLQAIIDQRFNAKLPCKEDRSRHDSCLRLASDLLAMLDANKTQVLQLLLAQPWVQQIVDERNEDVESMVSDAYEFNRKQVKEHLWVYPSKEMQEAIREVTGLSYLQIVRGNKDEADSARSIMEQQLWMWGKRIEAFAEYYPLLKDICKGLKKHQYPAALFAGGSLLMTLMTRCSYRFYDLPEKLCRLNSMVVIIGNPASGKSFTNRLYKILTLPIQRTDKATENAINGYREILKMKGDNKDKPRKPKLPMRLHPARTSTSQLIQDMVNSTEELDGEKLQLHMFTYDSELDNTIENDKSGSWMKKSGLEIKAFHNEGDGQAYSNNDSMITTNFNVTWNYLYTGTPIALRKKVNEHNIGSGLATRLTCIPMPSTNFEMMERNKTVDYESDHRLQEWAEKLNLTKGELPLQKVVDEMYDWTNRRMEEAAYDNSESDEMLLKRCAYHGINFSAPFIVMRHWDELHQEGDFWCGDFHTDEIDLQLATLIVNMQYACQRYFFGAMSESYFDNLRKDSTIYRPRKRKTVESYNRLPTEFTYKEVMRVYDLPNDSARKTISRLCKDKMIEKAGSKVEEGHTITIYKKLVNAMV